MTQHEAQLNGFLVNVFNDILRLEGGQHPQRAMQNLSVSEMHVLEAVEKSSVDASGAAGMAEVAAHLSITSGTLSVAVKTLEQKGYLVRSRGSRDKRRVTVALTSAARSALESHAAFHETLVARAAARLSEAEIAALSHRARLPARFFCRIVTAAAPARQAIFRAGAPSRAAPEGTHAP